MAWRPHGHAHADPRNPSAWGVCDRCSFWYLLKDLHWQYQFAGPNLQNLRLLVCDKCLDVPQPQLKPRILPPDPMPVMNARPENFLIDDSNWTVTEGDPIIIRSQDGKLNVTENSANQRLPADEFPVTEFFFNLTTNDGLHLVTNAGQSIVTNPV